MPVYEFKCPECGRTESKKRSVAARDLDPPECCQTNMKRTVGPVGFVLMGGGWFKDGYQKK